MYTRIIIGVDPAVSCGLNSDETGIVVVGLGRDKAGYVLDDLSIKGSPSVWAERVVKAYHQYKAHYVVAEVNQGGDLVESILKNVDSSIRFKAVHATKSKRCRAEPIAMLYEQRKVFHVRAFPELESQMCRCVPGIGKSPDRVDALVWALTNLMYPQKHFNVECWDLKKTSSNSHFFN